MPSFTVQLKELIKDDYSNVADIGLDWYPIFQDDYREGLNKKIIQHYWNREIGQETEFMFKFAMARKMNEIMPAYNQLYETELSRVKDANGNSLDPFSTVKLLTDTTSNDNVNATAHNGVTNTANSGSRTVNSETPQVQLAGNGDYAASGVDSTSASSGTSATDATNTQTSATTSDASTNGYQDHTILMLQRVRSAILNIDMLIIDELSDLFMGVWDNGDEFTRRNGIGYI